MERLDDTDERILAELAQDARATYAEIGQRVSLSAPAVKRRVDRMLDTGVIRGFTTVVDRNALGWNTEAYVQVFRHGTIAPDELRKAWIDIPEVVSAATVTGLAPAGSSTSCERCASASVAMLPSTGRIPASVGNQTSRPSVTPTPCTPGTYGVLGIPKYDMPLAHSTSSGVIGAASTSTSTWSGPGSGSGPSSTSGGSPGRVICAASIRW